VILTAIYFAFVHPHILYGIESYANTGSTHLHLCIISCYYRSCFNRYNRLPARCALPARWAQAFLVACRVKLLLLGFCYHYVFSLWRNKYNDDDGV